MYIYLYTLANVFLFSDNAANFYNLANANRTQIGKESKLRGTSVGYNKEMGRKDVLSTDHDTQSDTKGRHTRFSASFSSLFAIKLRSSQMYILQKFSNILILTLIIINVCKWKLLSFNRTIFKCGSKLCIKI